MRMAGYGKKGMGLLLLAVLCLFAPACKKKTEAENTDWARWDFSVGYMEDGMIYQDYGENLMKFLDYKTGNVYPLCVRPNCRHDSEECFAYALCGQVSFMGRLGEKWYYYNYYSEDGTEETLRSCNLDGGNERVVETYPYGEGASTTQFWGSVLFQDRCCIAAASSANMVEDPDDPGSARSVSTTGGIYRYHLDTGKREELCPEKTVETWPYTVYGIYKGQLVYSEYFDEKEVKQGPRLWIRKMDLETKEVSDLEVSGGCVYMGENCLLLNQYGDGERIVEYNLDTGRETVIFEGSTARNGVWEPELKAFTILDRSEGGNHHRVYRYTDEGDCEVLYEEEGLHPEAFGNGLVIGQDPEWNLAFIKKEDFLAGKKNWTLLEER